MFDRNSIIYSLLGVFLLVSQSVYAASSDELAREAAAQAFQLEQERQRQFKLKQ